MRPVRDGVLAILISLAIVGVMSGCGDGDKPAAYETAEIGHGYEIVAIPYRGRTVTCIKMHHAAGSNSSWGGLSCDYEAYWNNRPTNLNMNAAKAVEIRCQAEVLADAEESGLSWDDQILAEDLKLCEAG